MPSVGWIPKTSDKTKLIVHVDLWTKPMLSSRVGSERRVWNKLQDARDFAAKNGYSGIQCQARSC